MSEDGKARDYSERLRAEIEHFRGVENVHELPDIFHVWSIKYVRPKIENVLGVPIQRFEEFYAKYITRYAAENPGEVVTIASIGAGNGDFEVRIAQLLKATGVCDFRFHCIDINPAMLDRGRQVALAEQLTEHFEFMEIDVSDWAPSSRFSVVMANHSLHHIQELEKTFINIKRAIAPKGYFLSCDMIGRNGHMRWPEALEIVHDIWRTMPERYKYNHRQQRTEELYEDPDCSSEGFEGIRAQDILPLLVRLFKFEAFIAFGNLPDVFVERNFGHNFSPQNEEDVAFIYRIGEMNDKLISDGKIKPTQMMAVMRSQLSEPCSYYLHWSPEFCIRDPRSSSEMVHVPIVGCGFQEGAPATFWPDGWVSSPFCVKIRLDEDLAAIVLEGYWPETLDHRRLVSVRINGVIAVRETLKSGCFSFKIQCQAVAGELIEMQITASPAYCPAFYRESHDERQLGIVIRELRLVPSHAIAPLQRPHPFRRLVHERLSQVFRSFGGGLVR